MSLLTGHGHSRIYPRRRLRMRPWRGGARTRPWWKGKTYRRIGRRRWQGGFPAQMAALLRLLLRRGGAPVTAAGARGSVAVSCAKGCEEASVAGRKKDLPRSPIYRGGVVTGAVTTPPGSATPLRFCGLGEATQGHVYARHKEGYRIHCATHARDLRGRANPGKAASITQRIRARRRSVM